MAFSYALHIKATMTSAIELPIRVPMKAAYLAKEDAIERRGVLVYQPEHQELGGGDHGTEAGARLHGLSALSEESVPKARCYAGATRHAVR